MRDFQAITYDTGRDAVRTIPAPNETAAAAFQSVLCSSLNITPALPRHGISPCIRWPRMDGVPLAEVARLLGDSERTVEKVYGKHAPDYLRRAVNSLNLAKNKLLSPQL